MVSYISEDEPIPPQESPVFNHWKKGDEMVFTWLKNSIDVQRVVVSTSSSSGRLAVGLWNYLRDWFSPSSGLHKFSLYSSIATIQQGDCSVSAYLNQLKILWEELSDSFPKTTLSCCKATNDLVQEQKLMQFLMGLHPINAPLRDQILTMDPLPDVEKAFAHILEEEAKRNLPIHDPNSMHSVLRTEFQQDRHLLCAYCNQTNHATDNCQKLHGFRANHLCGGSEDGSYESRSMLIKHFTHEHPMILVDEIQDRCTLCNWSVPEASPGYGCLLCRKYLHKDCAGIPRELNYPGHQQHSLALLLNNPIKHESYQCALCGYMVRHANFYCASCVFSIHFECALLPHSLLHESHPHQLTISAATSSSHCSACGERCSEDLCFSCSQCIYKLHARCAFLPLTVEVLLPSKQITLTLAHGTQFNFDIKQKKCPFCQYEVNRSVWFYYSKNPLIVVDLICATVLAKGPLESVKEARNQMERLNLNGVAKEYKRILHQVRFDETRKGNGTGDSKTEDTVKEGTENRMYKHQHPLVLFEETVSKSFCSWCQQLLSGSIYGCSQTECATFMHKLCYEAPKEVVHPCHPDHPLTLIPRVTRGRKWCAACDSLIQGQVFCCNPCGIFLHPECALLPLQVEYKHHKHRYFELTYDLGKFNFTEHKKEDQGSNVDDGDEWMVENYCIRCELQIHEKWAYSCIKCPAAKVCIAHLACLAPSALPSRKMAQQADKQNNEISLREVTIQRFANISSPNP